MNQLHNNNNNNNEVEDVKQLKTSLEQMHLYPTAVATIDNQQQQKEQQTAASSLDAEVCGYSFFRP